MRTYLLIDLTDIAAFEGDECYRMGDTEAREGFGGKTTEVSLPSFKKAFRFSILAFLMSIKYKARMLLSASSLDDEAPSR
jgi:hypothetical protein